MFNKQSRIISKSIILLTMLFISSLGQNAFAMLNGVHGVKYSSSGEVFCEGSEFPSIPKVDAGSYFKGGACNIYASGYVPRSGQYQAKLSLSMNGYPFATSNATYVDSTKNISAQTLTFSGTNVNINETSPYAIHSCYTLVEVSTGQEWALGGGRGCSGYTPIPPTPPAPVINCTINNNNVLSVNLGTLDRALLPTVPGTGSIENLSVPVQCTSDTPSVTSTNIKMQLTYTPITVSGVQVIKSSSNGVGVTAIYDNKKLSSGSSISLNFNIGSTNTVNLGFEAVRNPSVAIGDVPTGAFSASAVLIMTTE